MRKTRSIGQDIERWWKVNEVQIPGTKDALYRAFLDSLPVCQATTTLLIDEMSPKIAPVQEILLSQTAPDFYLTQY